MKKTIAIAPFILLAAACGQNAGSGNGGGFEPRAAEFEAGFDAGDADAVVALYADDARLMAPNAATTIGLESVRATFGGMIEAGLAVDLEPIEVQSAGDIAYVVGRFTLMAGENTVDEGKYMETWHRGADGNWKMTNDIWNSDRPVASSGEGGHGNPHIMVFHEVEDGDRWLAAWTGEDSRRDQFKANGAAGVHTFRSAENPNLTGLVISVADMDALNAFLTGEEGAAAAEADGVDLEATTFLMEAK